MTQVTVANITTDVLAYQGKKVCTTRQLAAFYEAGEENIQKNYERNAGMETAARHADAVVDGWSDRAYAFLVDYVGANRQRRFMAEDVRVAAEETGFPRPPDNLAWGAVVAKAARKHLIKRIGYGPQSSASCHCSPKSIWVAK